MELNWTTFSLEIVNFLVLVWILKHFLYKPVLTAIAQRRAAIEKNLNAARASMDEAQSLKSRYESRLADWDKEKQAARETLHSEMAEQRERLMAALYAELQSEREKARAVEARQREDSLRKYQEVCLTQGTRFVSSLLSDLAGPELDARLFDLALAHIERLPAETLESIRLAGEGHSGQARVVSAYPLDEARRSMLAEKLERVLGAPVTCSFGEDAALLAGLRINLGPWIFHANLQDELRSFAECVNDTG